MDIEDAYMALVTVLTDRAFLLYTSALQGKIAFV